MSWLDKIVSAESLKGIKRKRSDKYIYETIDKILTEQYIKEGWELHKELKKSNKMKKIKPLDEQFEDEVWSLFYSLGFKLLNIDRNAKVPYDKKNPSLTKQIDIIAIDDETILLIECKCAKEGRRGNFKDALEGIDGYQGKLFNEIRRAFPDKAGRKARYIFATKNYDISEQDMDRMKSFQIQHFNSKTISYYSDLVKHLGSAARFQLLGDLFAGKEIKSMDNKIPAIRGEMGGQVYYSFAIEPENLLKIAYVLHRTDANQDMMPTYQRLIKRDRLKGIQDFVDSGGFFPNSIIVSIDTKHKGKKLQFDFADLRGDTDTTRIGILHLPQHYKTAYIIDGQHRLYGYSDSQYADKDVIPVIAFENLEQEKQVELFMQINENQKTVSKNLQITLTGDLLWNDDDWNKQRKALRARIAMDLGEKPSSPLFERVRIGENEISEVRNVTLPTIQDGLRDSDYLSTYGKNNTILTNGTFDKCNNEATLRILYRFIALCFDYIKENLPEEWDRVSSENGMLTSNNSVYAMIKVFNDIVNLLVDDKTVTPTIDEPEKIFKEAKYYMDPLIKYIENVSFEERESIKRGGGAGVRTAVWRTYQKAISEKRSNFKPEGLEEWIENNTRRYNDESFRMIQDIEQFLDKDFKERLEEYYGENWLMDGIPKKVYDSATKMAADKDYDKKLQRGTTDPWTCLLLIDYRDIAISNKNWYEVFEKYYTKPGEERISGGKNAKTNWMVKLNEIRNNLFHNYSVTKEQFELLESLHEWLME